MTDLHTPTATRPDVRSIGSWVEVVLLAALASYGLFWIGGLGGSRMALAVVAVYVVAVLAHVARARTGSMSGIAKGFFAFVIGLVGGFATWVGLLIVGMDINVFPDLFDDGDHPYAGLWFTGSVIAGLLGWLAMWGLLRSADRWAARR